MRAINSCGEGRVMSTDQKGCMDRNECLDLPCLNGASCINLEPKLRYRCVCLDGFWGENCELIQEGQTLKLSMGALAAILVCLLVILSEQNFNENKTHKFIFFVPLYLSIVNLISLHVFMNVSLATISSICECISLYINVKIFLQLNDIIKHNTLFRLLT